MPELHRIQDRRLSQTVKILLWVAATAVVGGRHWYLAIAARADADQAVAAIWQHHKKNGKFPQDLETAGVNAAELKQRWNLFYSN
ncbi:MAG TPA: hypothetical protein VGC21_19130 [Telluria sp.]|jgi:hypothetical protein